MFRFLGLQKVASHSPARVLIRAMSSAGSKPYNFQDVKKLVQHPEQDKVLVDVREPREVESYKMPTSINLPFQTAPSALSLSDDEFEEQFQFPKPKDNQELIFFCAKGMRAKAAEELARSYGFKNTGIYEGSISDWLAHGGDKIKPE